MTKSKSPPSVLDYYQHKFTENDWRHLCESTLPINHATVQKLDLSCCQMTDDRCIMLMDCLIHSRIHLLTMLLLSGNCLTDRSATAVSNYMQTNQKLQGLHLRFNNIGNRGVASIAKALSLHQSLQILDLSFNKFAGNGVKAICYALMLNNSLESLLLCGNKLKNCSTYFTESTKHSKKLTSLDLWNNELGLDLDNRFVKLDLSNLTSVNLSCNQIRDNEAESLANGLSSNSCLTKLDLSHNLIADHGGYSLANCIANNTKFKSVNLSDNQMTMRSCRSIVASVHDHKELLFLNLMRNDLSHDECKRLFSQLQISQSNSALNHEVCVMFSPLKASDDGTITIFRFPSDMVHVPAAEHDEWINLFLQEHNMQMNSSLNQSFSQSAFIPKRDVNEDQTLAQIIHDTIDNALEEPENSLKSSQQTIFHPLDHLEQLSDEDQIFDEDDLFEEGSPVVTGELSFASPEAKSFSAKRDNVRSALDLLKQNKEDSSHQIASFRRNVLLSPQDEERSSARGNSAKLFSRMRQA